jgi:hypothetical protein
MALDSVSGLFTRIQMNLGRGSNATIVSYVPEWVNIVQRQICKEARFWFCHAEVTNDSIAAGDETIDLPTDFMADDYLFLKNSDESLIELTSMEFEDYRRDFNDDTAVAARSTPGFYLVRETDILLRPISDAAYDYVLGYWKYLTDVTSGGSSNKLIDGYPRVLECGATARGFEYLQELDDAQYWSGEFEKELTKIKIANAERQFPDEMVLSVRPGARSSAISGRVKRIGGGRRLGRTGY